MFISHRGGARRTPSPGEEEWTQELERLAKACDEFEFKLQHVDSGLEGIQFYF
jgi:hypothetical protein